MLRFPWTQSPHAGLGFSGFRDASIYFLTEVAEPLLPPPHLRPPIPLETSGSLSLTTNDGLSPFGGLCVPEACSPDALSTPNFRYDKRRAERGLTHARDCVNSGAFDGREKLV